MLGDGGNKFFSIENLEVLLALTMTHPRTVNGGNMLIMKEETFGSVLGIAPVSSTSEGLRLANDSSIGLAGFVFSRDLARGLSLCEGMGREKGRYGVESYLENKTMYLSYEVLQ